MIINYFRIAFRHLYKNRIFSMSLITALVISFATISFRTIKAAKANPVSSLRSE
jgi:hypothetical protein